MTDVLSGTFMERQFGELAPEVAAAFVAAGKEAHTRSLDAKTGSRLPTNHPYGGTFWLALPDEVASHLLPLLDDAVPYPPQGSQYDLILWNGVVILPVKVIDGGTRNGRMRARTSNLRTRLTSVNMPAEPQPSLLDDLEGFGPDEQQRDALALVERARKALGDVASTIVVAAYACNPTSGLQVVEVGVATLDEDGFIHFSDSQRLSVIEPPTKSTKPKLVEGSKFHDARRPTPVLGLVGEPAEALGDKKPEANAVTPAPE